MDYLKESLAVKIIGVTVIVVIFVYFAYKLIVYLNNKRAEEPVWFGTSNIFGIYKDTQKPFEVPSRRLISATFGKEYSYCVWIKVDNWNYLYGKPKHILHRGLADMSVMSPGVFLHPTKNQLIVRVDSKETSNSYFVKDNSKIEGKSKTNMPSLIEATESDCRKACNDDDMCDNFTLDKISNECHFYKNGGKDTVTSWSKRTDAPVSNSKSFLKLRNMNPDQYSEYEYDSLNPCDIVDIPLQRWVHIGIVLWNRSLDVYLNGKLARSCALKGIPNINNGNLYITQNGGYQGDMATLRYYNRALNASEVYEIYREGQDYYTLSRKLLPNIKITFRTETETEGEGDTV
jgi:hypothetical protein